MKIGVCGIGGRMGRAVVDVLLQRGHSVGAALEDPNSPFQGKSAGELAGNSSLNIKVSTVSDSSVQNVDGVIDFSSPGGALLLLEYAVRHNKPIVIGTTGFSDAEKKSIEAAGGKIPVLFSPNMSVGVNLLFKLTEIASRTLAEGYDVEIFEAHHRFKKDAPSGTAKKLLEVVQKGSEPLRSAKEVHGRNGITGERSDKEIGILAMRGGDIVGEHTVFFCGAGERIELTHRLTSRETLARGAVVAMEFIATRSPGMYSMFDVLGFV